MRALPLNELIGGQRQVLGFYMHKSAGVHDVIFDLDLFAVVVSWPHESIAESPSRVSPAHRHHVTSSNVRTRPQTTAASLALNHAGLHGTSGLPLQSA